ncbi:MAG: hypothetical protein A2Y33_03630 [Spirochaetes bacterium GWF1_51_8]|nr:MAG: hypothetical protein A2Y33_03630 [Spirochaetes bacterium GWF1_51_8]
MPDIYCPQCKQTLDGTYVCGACGIVYEHRDGILRLTDAPNIAEGADGLEYIGFDTIAADYDDTRYGNPLLLDRLTEVLREMMPPKPLILDLGAGTGIFSVRFAKFAETVYACDISEGMLKLLIAKAESEKIKNIVPIRGNALDLPFPDNMFDIVTAFHVLHLIKDAEKAASEIWRVLKPGGSFLTQTPEFHDAGKSPSSVMDSLYNKLADERKIGLVKSPGWGRDDFLPGLEKVFGNYRAIDDSRLHFDEPDLIARSWRQIGDATRSSQIRIDRNAHDAIMREIEAEMKKQFGEDFLTKKFEHRLSLRVIQSKK